MSERETLLSELADPIIRQSEDRDENEEKSNGFIYKLTIIASIGGFLFGYDTGVVSGAILMIKADPIFDLTTQEIEAVVGITVGVACLFSLLGGWLNKSIGRRWTIIISSVLFGIGSINLGIAKTLWELLLGRAIIGAGLGIASMSVPIYLSECAPTAYRGMIVTINNLSITGGQLVAALTCGALSGVDEGWRWMLALALAPAVIQLLGFIFILPESPRYLIEKDQKNKARKILRKIRGGGNIDDEMAEMSRKIEESQNENWMALFVTRNGRHALIVGSMLQFFQQFTGINTVMYYSATIIYMSGLVTDPSEAVWFAALTASMNFIFTLVGLWTIEKLGRRKLILWSIAGCTVSLFILSGGFYWSHQIEDKVTAVRSNSSACSMPYLNHGCSDCLSAGCAFCFADGQGSCDSTSNVDAGYVCQSHSINSTVFWSDEFCPQTKASWMPVFGMMLYLATFAPGMGPVPWTVNAEIYPNSSREMGMATSTAVNWISNCIVSLTFLSILEAMGTEGGFCFYASFGILGFILIFLLLPETKGVSLDKMDELLSQGWIRGRKEQELNERLTQETVDDSEESHE